MKQGDFVQFKEGSLSVYAPRSYYDIPWLIVTPVKSFVWILNEEGSLYTIREINVNGSRKRVTDSLILSKKKFNCEKFLTHQDPEIRELVRETLKCDTVK